jgi:hypothetical protein
MSRMSSELAVANSNLPEVAPKPAGLSDEDARSLREAVATLERSTLVGRLSAMAGRPLELLGRTLPAPAMEVVSRATEGAMRTALKTALTTLPKEGESRFRRLDTFAAMASGAVGGALGLATLPLELPVSTVLMLRTIAVIARREGEDLENPETALACLEVFALGSRTASEDLASSGYFAVRGMLAKSLSQAAKLAATQGVADASAPALVRFMSMIASRFGVVVSQKVAAGAVPILGALGGAAVNGAFIGHFRTIATAHFTVRRLERSYGKEAVRTAYAAAQADLDESRIERA